MRLPEMGYHPQHFALCPSQSWRIIYFKKMNILKERVEKSKKAGINDD